MKNYTKEFALGTTLILFSGALIYWLARNEMGTTSLQVSIAALIIVIGTGAFVRSLIKKRRDFQTGSPAEDEFTVLAKMYAGSQAFLYSIYLWLLIFFFNTSFTNNREMLGVGILGSALIYYICLWYFKSTGAFDEK